MFGASISTLIDTHSSRYFAYGHDAFARLVSLSQDPVGVLHPVPEHRPKVTFDIRTLNHDEVRSGSPAAPAFCSLRLESPGMAYGAFEAAIDTHHFPRRLCPI